MWTEAENNTKRDRKFKAMALQIKELDVKTFVWNWQLQVLC